MSREKDRTAVSWVLAVRRRAFLPPCPVGWIRLLELRLNREQGIRRDGPILEMRGQLEALHQQRAQHQPQVIDVDRWTARRASTRGFGEHTEARVVQPFGPDEQLVVIDVPGQ